MPEAKHITLYSDLSCPSARKTAVEVLRTLSKYYLGEVECMCQIMVLSLTLIKGDRYAPCVSNYTDFREASEPVTSWIPVPQHVDKKRTSSHLGMHLSEVCQARGQSL